MRTKSARNRGLVVVGMVAAGVGLSLSGAEPVAAGVQPSIAAWDTNNPVGHFDVTGKGFTPRGAVVIGFTEQDGSGRVDWFQVTASRYGSFAITHNEDCSTRANYSVIAWDRSTNIWSN